MLEPTDGLAKCRRLSRKYVPNIESSKVNDALYSHSTCPVLTGSHFPINPRHFTHRYNILLFPIRKFRNEA